MNKQIFTTLFIILTIIIVGGCSMSVPKNPSTPSMQKNVARDTLAMEREESAEPGMVESAASDSGVSSGEESADDELDMAPEPEGRTENLESMAKKEKAIESEMQSNERVAESKDSTQADDTTAAEDGESDSPAPSAPTGLAGGAVRGDEEIGKPSAEARGEVSSESEQPRLALKTDADKSSVLMDQVLAESEMPTIEEFRVRSKFPQILYYNPTLITDEDGRTGFAFPSGDEITQYNLGIHAATRQGDWGYGETTFKTFQPVFINLRTPEKLRTNDEIQLSALVFNYSGSMQDINIGVSTSGNLAVSSPWSFTVSIPASNNAVVPITLKAVSIGDGTITVTASSAKFRDAVRKTIKIHPDKHEFRIRQEGVANSDKTELHISIPANSTVLKNDATVTVIVDPSYGALQHYRDTLNKPHASLNDSLSLLMSATFARQQFKDNALLSDDMKSELDNAIETSWLRLLAFRKPDGFSFYPSGKHDTLADIVVADSFNRIADKSFIDPALIEFLNKRMDTISRSITESQINRLYAATVVVERKSDNKKILNSINGFIDNPLIMNSSDPVTLSLAYRCAAGLGLNLDFTRALQIASSTGSSGQFQNVQSVMPVSQDSSVAFSYYGYILAINSLQEQSNENAKTADDLSAMLADLIYSQRTSSLDKTNAIIAIADHKSLRSFSTGSLILSVNGKIIESDKNSLVSEIPVSLRNGDNVIKIESQNPGVFYCIKGRYYSDLDSSEVSGAMRFDLQPDSTIQGNVSAKLALLDPVTLIRNHTVIHLPIPFGIKPVDSPKVLARRMDADYCEIKPGEIILYYSKRSEQLKPEYTIPLSVENKGNFFLESPSVETDSGTVNFITQKPSRFQLI